MPPIEQMAQHTAITLYQECLFELQRNRCWCRAQRELQKGGNGWSRTTWACCVRLEVSRSRVKQRGSQWYVYLTRGRCWLTEAGGGGASGTGKSGFALHMVGMLTEPSRGIISQTTTCLATTSHTRYGDSLLC